MQNMTEKERKFRRQRYYGLGISLIGFLVFVIIFLLYHYSGYGPKKGFVTVGYVIIFIGVGIYLHAFIRGMQYTKSEEHKKDLIANQPWE